MSGSTPFQVDKAAVERFIDSRNTLYQALGLTMAASHHDIVERNSALRKINSPQYIHLVAMRAAQVEDVLYNATKRKEYDRTIREITLTDLRHYLDAMTEDDNLLDDKELQGYFSIGNKKGLTQQDLQAFLDEYLKARSDVRRGGPAPPPPRSTPPPPSPSRAPATPQAPPNRAGTGRTRPSEERARWVTATTAAAAILGAIIIVLVKLPFSFRLLVIAGCLGFAIASVRTRKDWRAWIAVVVALFVASGNPLLLGLVVGIILVAGATMAAHALRGSPMTAAVASCVIFALSVGAGFRTLRAGDHGSVLARTARSPGGTVVTDAVRAPGMDTGRTASGGRTPSGNRAPAANTRIPEARQIEMYLVSDPAGAEVTIAGRRMGVTPATCRLAPGRQEIRFAKQGYEPVERTVTLDASLTERGRAERTVEVGLVPMYARQLKGRWVGTIDGKPMVLVLDQVALNGALSGRGSVTLASGDKEFPFNGTYSGSDGHVTIKDQNTGLEFTGAFEPGPPPTMSGAAQMPGVPLSRSWSVRR